MNQDFHLRTNFLLMHSRFLLLLAMLASIAYSSAANYKLKFAEDLRSVSTLYNIPYSVLDSLNPNINLDFAIQSVPHIAIKSAEGVNIKLPSDAKLTQNPDMALLQLIYMRNIGLYFASSQTALGTKEGKRIHEDYVKRMIKDFGMKSCQRRLGETLTVIGLRYGLNLLELENLNPAIVNYINNDPGVAFTKEYGGKIILSDLTYRTLQGVNVVLPANATIKEDENYNADRLWSDNLLERATSGSFAWNEKYGKEYVKVYRKNFNLKKTSGNAMFNYICYLYSYKKDYDTARFNAKYLLNGHFCNDGTLFFGLNEAQREYRIYILNEVIDNCNKKLRLAAEKKARRSAKWKMIAGALVETLANSAQQMANGYFKFSNALNPYNAYTTFNTSPSFISPLSNYNICSGINSMSFNFGNCNAGLNAALITANSQQRINDSWSQFQNAMQSAPIYSFDEINQMSCNTFNYEFGLNFSSEQYNAMLSNWSEENSRGSYVGTSSEFPSKPNDMSSSRDMDAYYRNAYSRWEKIVSDTYNSLTLLGSRSINDGSITGSIGDRGNPGGSTTSLKMSFIDQQKQMMKLRREAANCGVIINPSKWESATVN